MSTTWGPSDHSLQRGAAGRSGSEAKVIPLSSIRQRSAPRTPQAIRQTDSAQLLHWPHRPTGIAVEPTPYPRRRRRSTTIRQWLPTVVFAGIVGLLVVLLIAIRMLLASAAPAPAPSPEAPVAAAAPVAQPQGQVREPLVPAAQIPPTAAQVAPTPQSSVHFESRPIEPSYTVAAGDNLWSIAQKNRTTAEAIQSINNLPDRATLHIGQRLVMP